MLHVIIKITQQRSRNFNAKDDVRIIGTPWWCFSIILFITPSSSSSDQKKKTDQQIQQLDALML